MDGCRSMPDGFLRRGDDHAQSFTHELQLARGRIQSLSDMASFPARIPGTCTVLWRQAFHAALHPVQHERLTVLGKADVPQLLGPYLRAAVLGFVGRAYQARSKALADLCQVLGHGQADCGWSHSSGDPTLHEPSCEK